MKYRIKKCEFGWKIQIKTGWFKWVDTGIARKGFVECWEQYINICAAEKKIA